MEVKEGTSCPVKAYGPGLSGGIVGYPASFYLETNGDSGSLGWHDFFSLNNPECIGFKSLYCNLLLFIIYYCLLFIIVYYLLLFIIYYC